jgi:hypothetical protein
VTSSTEAVLSGTIDAAPTITNQPASLSVVTGAAATFTVVTNGTAPLSYQWLRNGEHQRSHGGQLHHPGYHHRR